MKFDRKFAEALVHKDTSSPNRPGILFGVEITQMETSSQQHVFLRHLISRREEPITREFLALAAADKQPGESLLSAIMRTAKDLVVCEALGWLEETPKTEEVVKTNKRIVVKQPDLF